MNYSNNNEQVGGNRNQNSDDVVRPTKPQFTMNLAPQKAEQNFKEQLKAAQEQYQIAFRDVERFTTLHGIARIGIEAADNTLEIYEEALQALAEGEAILRKLVDSSEEDVLQKSVNEILATVHTAREANRKTAQIYSNYEKTPKFDIDRDNTSLGEAREAANTILSARGKITYLRQGLQETRDKLNIQINPTDLEQVRKKFFVESEKV